MAGQKKRKRIVLERKHAAFAVLALGVFLCCVAAVYAAFSFSVPALQFSRLASATSTPADPSAPPLDKAEYDRRLWLLANNGTTTMPADYGVNASTTATSTKRYLWPAKAVYPEAGAILPFYRVVAYYGNFYSTQMGVLGQYPPDVMLAKLASTTREWAAADPSTPVMPAVDYIAVTAQGSAGADGMYRARMPAGQIEKALGLADQIHGLLILDVQVGKSTLQKELPLLEAYLKLPNVELAIDPEFSMKDGVPPGDEIGTYSAADITYAAQLLAQLADENHLPPKILIVHRFTQEMVTNYRAIKPLPEVEIVMDMDGWGSKAKKINTYRTFIAAEPVQFTGFKLFYKNDLKPPSAGLMTPQEVLKLSPKPIFIQYQ